jgi:hypothetical protein
MTRLKHWLVSGCVAAGIAALPGAAAGLRECAGSSATTVSSADSNQQTGVILQQVQADVDRIADEATSLQSYPYDSSLVWESHGQEASRLREAVNNMADNLCQLQAVRQSVTPAQQQAIDTIAANEPLIANNTEDAIAFLNTQPNNLWIPAYQKSMTNLYNEAQAVNHAVKDAMRSSS